MPPFVHLHLHSEYSMLDGANRLEDVLAAARAAEMPAMALTDHGNLFGAVKFYNAARRAGVEPILGIEAYVAPGRHTDRDPARRSTNHLVLLARSEQGYRNLLQLTTRSFLDGFYYKPRVDRELLRAHAEGLVCLSACLKGEINERIIAGQEAAAERVARDYLEIFGEGNFYLELQDHGIAAQRHANEVLCRIARRLGVPVVATNDCHYLRRQDATAHDVLLCIGTQKALTDPNRLRYASDQFYLKNGDEMAALFPDCPEAIENTLRIAEQCRLELPSGAQLPAFPVPEGHTLESFFAAACREGLDERLRELGRGGTDERAADEIYRERLEQEIAVIARMEFAGYFLIVWDFIRHARAQGIPVGPGRGSAAGSLVAWALRITDIDPLRYGLVFERFLNPERVSLPDIDIDFCMRRRGEVIQYVSEKYGRDRVAQIITFGTLGPKAVVRDVGRVLGLPHGKVDRIAKLIPDMTKSVEEAVESVPALREEAGADSEVAQVLAIGGRLGGLTRHASVHAAGVVISPQPIEQLVPLCRTANEEIVTQWDKDVVEGLGLLKMDFLGLRTLTVLDDAQRMLRHQGIDLDLDRVPLDDAATLQLFCDGRTDGIFQFESSGMKDLLRRVQPSRFEDLAALNALYRPGALEGGTVKQYVECKQGLRRPKYLLPQVQPILEETYGVIVYQEQVMRIAQEVAGFTMGEGDLLRKAMGKKIPEVMGQQKEKFLTGAERNGVSRGKAAQLWEYIAPFAGYGFNKSHSVAYAMLAYKTAYLKAHYPVAFMAAMLTSEMGSKDNVAKYSRECRQLGLRILPPEINQSEWAFTAVGDAIRFGLGAVKGVGETAVEAILAARRQVGRFRSLAHLAAEVDLRTLNRGVFEALIKSGALDGFGAHRAALLASLDGVIDSAQQRRREIEQGQGTLFLGGAPTEAPVADVPPWDERTRLLFEKDVLGFYLTGNPLSEHQEQLARLVTHTSAGLVAAEEQRVTLGGIVTQVRQRKIKTGPNAGKVMGLFVLEDLDGSVPATLFAGPYQRFAPQLVEGAIVLVRGMARDRGAGVEVTVEEVVSLDRARQALVRTVELELDERCTSRELVELREVLAEHAGDVPVRLCIRVEGRSLRVTPDARFRVRYDAALVGRLESLLGKSAVRPA
jgi:DNA polymerase-3 subunit alpha